MKLRVFNSGTVKSLISNFVSLFIRGRQSAVFKNLNYDPVIESLTLRTKARYEVAQEYDISERTLNRWFKRENLKIPPGLIYPSNLKIIYLTFGVPKKHRVI